MMKCVVCGEEAEGTYCKNDVCVGYCKEHKEEVCKNGTD